MIFKKWTSNIRIKVGKMDEIIIKKLNKIKQFCCSHKFPPPEQIDNKLIVTCRKCGKQIELQRIW